MNLKKSQTLTMSTITVIALVLVVLVALIIIFGTTASEWVFKTRKCLNHGGECIYSDQECDYNQKESNLFICEDMDGKSRKCCMSITREE